MNKLLIVIFFVFSVFSFSQDLSYARYVINELSSPSMRGRGYAGKGDHKAEKFIRGEFKKYDVKPFKNDYLQTLSLSINTFPHKIHLRINNEELQPGKDYLVSSSSPAIKGTFNVVWLLNDSLFDKEKDKRFEDMDLSDKFIITDKYHKELKKENLFGSKGVIILKGEDEKLWWHVSNGNKVLGFVALDVKKGKISPEVKQVNLNIRNKFIKEYKTSNVIGYVKGKTEPDTFIVFTAHYDHLGMMGKRSYFPGANDNASGTAMVMNIARYFSNPENQPDYSVAFMLFAGEEAGLYGSRYYVDHPLFPLSNIRFLINLDMVGTGSDGITIVNGKIFKREFDRMCKINEKNGYLNEIKERGEACNSDHCPFYKKDIPAVFIYTRGKEYSEYHTINDVAKDLPLTEYKDLFLLLVDFVESF
ncbi:MAG: M28 family peptidase [Bacteroidetes bacterium]|nr:M28 family peptidase [Bacteroidota bacterium]